MAKRSYQAHASIAGSSRRDTDRRDTSQFGISMNESHSGMGYHEDRQMSIADMQQDQERLRTANNKALRVLITPDLPHTPEDDHRKPSSTSSAQLTTSRPQLPKLAAHRRSFAIHANSRTNSETALVVNTVKSREDDCKKALLHLVVGFCLGVFATLLILGCMVVLIDPFDSNSTCTRTITTNALNLTHPSPNS